MGGFDMVLLNPFRTVPEFKVSLLYESSEDGQGEVIGGIIHTLYHRHVVRKALYAFYASCSDI